MRAPKLLLIFLFAGLTAVGCASFDERDVVATSDSSLTSSVRTALANEAGYGATMNVNVTTIDGTVQLTGFVDTAHGSLRAEQIARSVDGVRAVRNDLIITPQPTR